MECRLSSSSCLFCQVATIHVSGGEQCIFLGVAVSLSHGELVEFQGVGEWKEVELEGLGAAAGYVTQVAVKDFATGVEVLQAAPTRLRTARNFFIFAGL